MRLQSLPWQTCTVVSDAGEVVVDVVSVDCEGVLSQRTVLLVRQYPVVGLVGIHAVLLGKKTHETAKRRRVAHTFMMISLVWTALLDEVLKPD